MQPDAPLLELAGVSRSYAAPGQAEAIPVLSKIDLRLQSGESLAIIGPSGCGKSTLLHLMGALDRPSSGRVFLAGRDLTTLDDAELARARNRELGFVFQAHYLLPQCTVWENVLVPALAEPGQEQSLERAARLLERVGLAHRRDHRPGELSGGERQRAAVVRALVNGPRLLLADEPTGALDEKSALALAQLLGELNREEKVTLVVVTHSRELARGMDRIMELRQGRLQTVHLS